MHHEILPEAGSEVTRWLQILAVGAFAALAGCSNDGTGEQPGAGGSALGGSVGVGGGTSGGVSAMGGTSSGGSSSGVAGNPSGGTASGGSANPGNGGVPGAGGANAAGGTTGGAIGTGGSTAAGGVSSSGGTPASGGTASLGGTTGSGGAAGGASSSGGTPASGGASSGGTSSGGAGTGGAKATGGSSGSGGGTSAGVVGQPIGFATLNGGTTGGKGGQVVTVKTLAELTQYAGASQPYVILIDGTISNGTTGARVNISSNKSLVGIGSTAFLQGVGLEIKNSNNVIIQNLKLTLVGTTTPANVNGGDAIAINGTSKNVWIDHCELYSEDPTVQTNVDKYDGLIDIRDQTGFVTVSWSYLHDHHKTSLVGASDTDIYADRKITYHHNYMRKVVKRAPAEYRGAVGHFFNNYIVGIPTTEASFLLVDTCVRIEKSIYENVNFAIYTVASGTMGKAERIDNIATQSRAWPPSCVADIPYEYASALTTTTSDVKTVVPAGAGVGKL